MWTRSEITEEISIDGEHELDSGDDDHDYVEHDNDDGAERRWRGLPQDLGGDLTPWRKSSVESDAHKINLGHDRGATAVAM